MNNELIVQFIGKQNALLGSPDPLTRRAAVKSLSEIGNVSTYIQFKYYVIPSLLASLDDQAAEVREAATAGLGWILMDYNLAELPALLKLDGGLIVTALVRLLGDSDAKVRAAAAKAVLRVNPAITEAIPLLMQALAYDSDSDVREAAGRTLGAIGPSATVLPALVRAMECDESIGVRLQAAGALGMIAPQTGALAFLAKTLQHHDDKSMRLKAAHMLRVISPCSAAAVPALIQAMQREDEDKDIRLEASKALREIGGEAVTAETALTQAMHHDRDKDIRREAVMALARIEPRGRKAAAALIQVMQRPDEDDEVRFQAAWGLGIIGTAPEVAVPALIETMRNDKSDSIRRTAIGALASIGTEAEAAVPALIDEFRKDMGDSAAHALGLIGETAIPALIEVLEDPRRSVEQGHAIEAVRSMVFSGTISPSSYQLTDALINIVVIPNGDHCREAVLALGNLAKAIADDTIHCFLVATAIHSSNAELRTSAAKALMMTGTPPTKAIDYLQSYARNANEPILLRARAYVALEFIDEEQAATTAFVLEKSSGPAALDMEGIEVMGVRAFEMKENLEHFRRIGEDCKRRGVSSFKLARMAALIGVKASNTAGNYMDEVSVFFRDYFRETEGLDIPADEDESTDGRGKVFDRGQGKRGITICRKGWQAWELTCQFLDRQKQRDVILEQARRQKG